MGEFLNTTFEDYKASLKEFFANNQKSSLKMEEDGSVLVEKPWGDKTLAIRMPEEAEELASLVSCMNAVALPPELSAILHTESGQLEVLWTAHRLRSHALEVKDRKFSILWEGKHRKCKFGKTTNLALTLAKHCVPVANASETNHRNIVPFYLFANEKEHPILDEPKCFFVDCDGLKPDQVIEFLMHLNSYMIYFDRRTPRVLLHSVSESRYVETDRHMEGKFPLKVVAKKIDPNLLSYWTEAFRTTDQIMRFLLMYRIIEYSSFSYLDGEVLKAVRRELGKPSLPSNVDLTARKIAELISQSKELDTINRTQTMISSLVDLEKIWSCIEVNLDYFKTDNVFDGGYTVKALLSGKCDYENWQQNGVRNTFDRLRQLRNALAHGQDGTTRGTVRPTRENAQSLTPWLNVIETIAADAIFLQ